MIVEAASALCELGRALRCASRYPVIGMREGCGSSRAIAVDCHALADWVLVMILGWMVIGTTAYGLYIYLEASPFAGPHVTSCEVKVRGCLVHGALHSMRAWWDVYALRFSRHMHVPSAMLGQDGPEAPLAVPPLCHW